MPLKIEVNDDGQRQKVDRARLKKAARLVLSEGGFNSGELSIAVVDDEQMQELNRRYLQHDYPTDVLSFLLESDAGRKWLEGQIIVSADYAAREAARYGWEAGDELLLYVIHGCLHLVGHDDATAEGQRAMREAEGRFLEQFGLSHRYDS